MSHDCRQPIDRAVVLAAPPGSTFVVEEEVRTERRGGPQGTGCLMGGNQASERVTGRED